MNAAFLFYFSGAVVSIQAVMYVVVADFK